MDPSIMKLLEEDEDETMHSGADVEAFTAALNRDIGGDASTTQPADSDSTTLSQGSSHTSNQFLSHWQTSTHDKNASDQSRQDALAMQQNDPQAAEMNLKQHGTVPENQKAQDGTTQDLNQFSLQHKPFQDDSFEPQAERNMLNASQAMDVQDAEVIPFHNQGPDRTHNPDQESELVKLQNRNNQQVSVTGMSTSATGNRQAMATGSSNLQAASNRGGKVVPFAMLLPVIQPQLDKDRAMQLNTLYLKLRKNEISKEGFVRHMRSIIGDQMLKMAVYKLQSQAARNTQNLPSQLPMPSQAPAQRQQLPTPSTAQMMTDSKTLVADNNALKSHEVEHQSDSHGLQGSALPGTLKDESIDMQSSRMGFSTPTSTVPPNSMSPSISTQKDMISSLNHRIPSTTSPIALGNNAKSQTKKPAVGQKKPLEALGSSPPASSKKQKVSGAFLDQSIEQLNDVTAVSGVNLREEEEQLFSGPKEDSRVSEASRRVVQEEEERLILEKIPLQRKLAEIIAKNGLKGISSDVERCLSLCVEERIRGLLGNLIRVSKQRLDIEKPRHKTFISSDVRQQIMMLNQKAREEWDKKQAEAEKLQRLNEPESSPGVDGEKEKDDGRGKLVKVNKEEDDKMRTTAANVAARAAVGGDDMLSKWQLMAEQARQKREGVVDVTSGSLPGKDVGRQLSSRNTRDNQEADKRGHPVATSSPGAVKKIGRNQLIVPHTKVARSISVKDVIAVLEREPQMSKSTLMYRLYENVRLMQQQND